MHCLDICSHSFSLLTNKSNDSFFSFHFRVYLFLEKHLKQMSFCIYTPITCLNTTKIKWNIRVRAQAIWRGVTRETKEFRGYNLILVDDLVMFNLSKIVFQHFISAKIAYKLILCNVSGISHSRFH